MTAIPSVVTVDGGHGEGGGGIVRTALAMAALTQQAVEISSIRAGTAYPGLDVEDWVIARALAESCQAETVGMDIGSNALTFHPAVRARSLHGALEVPPSIRRPNALVVLSSLMPVLARTGGYSSISCEGETYGANSLTYDYFANAALYACRKMGLCGFPEQKAAGFGRESAGLVALDVEPSALNGVNWSNRGRLVACQAVISASELPQTVTQRGVAHLELMGKAAGIAIEADGVRVTSDRPGAYVTVWAHFEHGCAGMTAMGQKGLRIESLAQHAFDALLKWMEGDATVDPFLADQLLIPAIFAESDTTFKTTRLTERFLTSVWVAKQFAPIHITVRGKQDGPGVVTVRRD